MPADSKILVVDDASFMRLIIKDILVKNGFTACFEAASGIEAVQRFHEQEPDLVLMDITMPGVDGISALRAIRKTHPQAKVIMCSAMGQQSLVLQAFQEGARDFVVKPFDAFRVVDAVRRVLA
ncbi:MAG: response regulator [Candidatus Sericytochromatia bacterium]|nr:response regulator [Candidatus Sericytochromatia bacterium]